MNILDQLHAGKIILSDGAMGTELQKRGMPSGACPEEWNILHPEVIKSIHNEYYLAGSDIVETNSFGCNRARLARYGLENRIAELCRRSVELAREVCPIGKYVAGSIGPTGLMLKPLGETSPAVVYDIIDEQCDELAGGGVDLFYVETMMAIEEAEIAVRAVKEKTHLPIIATMTFEVSPNGIRTLWGVDIPTAVSRLTAAGADAIGANCGNGFDEMIVIIKAMRPLTSLPIIAQPNAGIPALVDGKPVYSETPDFIAPKIKELLKLGVNIIGGCCGTGPAHIHKMRELVDAR